MGEEIKRNCNTCKRGLFGRCDALKSNDEYQSIWNHGGAMWHMTEAHKFKENYICDEYKCKYIEYPIEVSGFEKNDDRERFVSYNTGKFVKIRPCESDKTHLGLYVGDLPVNITISHNPETKVANVGYMTNPAIFVFDLNKIVYGMESWWGEIEGEEDLKEITDGDIENVWYVKALKSIASQESDT